MEGSKGKCVKCKTEKGRILRLSIAYCQYVSGPITAVSSSDCLANSRAHQEMLQDGDISSVCQEHQHSTSRHIFQAFCSGQGHDSFPWSTAITTGRCHGCFVWRSRKSGHVGLFDQQPIRGNASRGSRRERTQGWKRGKVEGWQEIYMETLLGRTH